MQKTDWVSLPILPISVSVGITGLVDSADAVIPATMWALPLVAGEGVRRAVRTYGTFPGPGSLNWFQNIMKEGGNVRKSLCEIFSTIKATELSGTVCPR